MSKEQILENLSDTWSNDINDEISVFERPHGVIRAQFSSKGSWDVMRDLYDDNHSRVRYFIESDKYFMDFETQYDWDSDELKDTSDDFVNKLRTAQIVEVDGVVYHNGNEDPRFFLEVNEFQGEMWIFSDLYDCFKFNWTDVILVIKKGDDYCLFDRNGINRRLTFHF